MNISPSRFGSLVDTSNRVMLVEETTGILDARAIGNLLKLKIVSPAIGKVS